MASVRSNLPGRPGLGACANVNVESFLDNRLSRVKGGSEPGVHRGPHLLPEADRVTLIIVCLSVVRRKVPYLHQCLSLVLGWLWTKGVSLAGNRVCYERGLLVCTSHPR